ncbi:MAG: WbqC family protein [Bacteroidales bacterium]|nr:WbqC family protein [Bacteroidales bacterium]
MLLSTAFLPPAEWFALAARDITLSDGRVIPSVVQLEAHENFIKQSWRSRCLIGTSSGSEAILVPVVHGESLITSVKIDYSTPWLVRAERAIDTAYRSAPFYEHYRDELFSILESRHETLWELNLQLINYLFRCLHLPAGLCNTSCWTPPGELADDYRYALSPKLPSPLTVGPYYQVFAHRRGFIPGLSIIDLLFGEGPEAAAFLYLRQ